jgi:hypothetical protein
LIVAKELLKSVETGKAGAEVEPEALVRDVFIPS